MYSARWGAPAVALLFVSSLCGLSMFAQTVPFLSLEAKSLRPSSLATSPRPCSVDANLSGNPGDIPNTSNAFTACDHPETNVAPIAPCRPSSQVASGCGTSADTVRDDLNTMGKQGQAILRAREKVLEILQAENACTQWYRSKEPDPAALFRTLTFSLDRQGEVFVHRTPESNGMELIRSPYVAKVIQGEGTGATVTINVNGAFFFQSANVIDDRLEGGPLTFRTARLLQVGPYVGGSFRAQVLALLHEFGHVIDLLPQDRDDYEGKSRQNTNDVLRACRAEVESKKSPHSLLASR